MTIQIHYLNVNLHHTEHRLNVLDTTKLKISQCSIYQHLPVLFMLSEEIRSILSNDLSKLQVSSTSANALAHICSLDSSCQQL